MRDESIVHSCHALPRACSSCPPKRARARVRAAKGIFEVPESHFLRVEGVTLKKSAAVL